MSRQFVNMISKMSQTQTKAATAAQERIMGIILAVVALFVLIQSTIIRIGAATNPTGFNIFLGTLIISTLGICLAIVFRTHWKVRNINKARATFAVTDLFTLVCLCAAAGMLLVSGGEMIHAATGYTPAWLFEPII